MSRQTGPEGQREQTAPSIDRRELLRVLDDVMHADTSLAERQDAADRILALAQPDPRLVRIAELHLRNWTEPVCDECRRPWPCATRAALDAV